MFLQPDDLILSLEESQYQQLREGRATQLHFCLKRAEEEARALIRTQFEETTLFEVPNPLDRNALLIGIVVDIAVYHFLKMASLQEIPDKYIKSYDEAMIKLNRIHKGSLVPAGFPPKVINTDGKTNHTFMMESATKFRHEY